jgi:L-glyceraldehyde 3-phosphate reductase
MIYNRCGNSGLLLPAISLGCWQNFGGVDNFENARQMLRTAFDLGITHFDLANNYGPPYGSAEENFGRVFDRDLKPYRDELIISTKAGWDMWPGPYGEHGSRKHMLASLNQSLKRLGLDYVDIFYHHRIDPVTPLEETMGALATAVNQGKALYVGISQYDPERTAKAAKILKEMNVRCLIHQPKYSMLKRKIENGLLDTLEDTGMGAIVFCPLAQGLLTDKYLKNIPKGSRATKSWSLLNPEQITANLRQKLNALNDLAKTRNQSLPQMAIAWTLRDKRITTALIGASSPAQIKENIKTLDNPTFTKEELTQIDNILA